MHKIRKMMSIDEKLLDLAKKRAIDQKVSFSEYISVLINRDLSLVNAPPEFTKTISQIIEQLQGCIGDDDKGDF